jgi:hypothetical protein
MDQLRSLSVLAVAVLFCAACATVPGPTPAALAPVATQAPTLAAAPVASQAPVGMPTAAPETSPATPVPEPTAVLTTAAAPAATTETKSAPVGPYPAAPQGIPPGVLPQPQPLGQAVAFAWNNLGMHCYQSDFSRFLILPPYNVLWTQVVARGEEPRIIQGGVSVEYNLPQETQPEQHTDFWQWAPAYGWNLQPGVGLTGKKIAGAMDAAGDHFIAEGVPVVDVNDAGTWDPFPFFVVQVKNGADTVATTVNVAPASTEMSCYICHKADTQQGVMEDILGKHDASENTTLLDQARSGKPVLCNACHADPAMGVTDNHNAKTTLSGAMHTWHATRVERPGVPENACQSCHPGPSTNCLRDIHAKQGLTCTDCHGGMAQVGDGGRTPWVNLPACESCHTKSLQKASITKIADPLQGLTANGDALYRNSKAHGGGGIYCAACHGSPHAIYPTITERDNQQSIRLQGQPGTINQCEVCHVQKPDEPFWHVRTQGD